MDVLSVKEMVAREEEAFRSGVTAAALMEAAGEAMAGRIAAIYPHTRIFLVLAGKGNNGGDGLAVARHLANAGRRVQVVLAAPGDELGDLARAQLARFHGLFPSPEILPWRE